MKCKTILFRLLTVFSLSGAYGQADTIVCYDFDTKTTTFILPVEFDETITFAKTSSYTGSLGNKVNLALTPPVSNLFQGSSFSKPAPASGFMDVTSYPARTAIKMEGYTNGVKINLCSGMMVGPGLVLTAGHCPHDIGNKGWPCDSLFVIPAYDNAIAPYGRTGVKKAYIFKRFYKLQGPGWEDIALLELKSPVGNETGWIGMAFSSDASYFSGKVFHKFSYPGSPDLTNPSKIYNGDTMYYNYGYIEEMPVVPGPTYLGVNSQEANGIPGQSGSSFCIPIMDRNIILSGYLTSVLIIIITRSINTRFTN